MKAEVEIIAYRQALLMNRPKFVSSELIDGEIKALNWVLDVKEKE